MGRPKINARISIKGRDGVTTRLGFAPMADGRIAIYRNGRISDSMPSGNSTEIGQRLSGWLRSQMQPVKCRKRVAVADGEGE